ncbi:MAG: hypothetical protein LQ337_008394, partial [Flavoplaca oasis]
MPIISRPTTLQLVKPRLHPLLSQCQTSTTLQCLKPIPLRTPLQPWLRKSLFLPHNTTTRDHINLKRRQRGYATLTTGNGDEVSHRIWDGNTNGSISNDQVARLAARRLHPLALGDLVRHGRPPLSTPSLLSSANFTLSLLPIRLAHRIQALRNLPFIVVSNPHIASIYANYTHSLSTLLPWQERRITTLEEEVKFTAVMADLVATHSNTIPTLARGFLECRRYISPGDVTRFLDEHLRARIGTRLIAEQHIALHLSSQPHNHTYNHGSPSSPQTTDPSSCIGVIDTALHPAHTINHCSSTVSEICELKYGVRSGLIINGQTNATITHVPTHLEYIITELLKNAFRATVESGKEREPIEVTIAASPADEASSVGATEPSNDSAASGSSSIPGVTIRIRDRGGGIAPDVLPNIWAYSFTTFADEDVMIHGGNGGNGNIDALNAISGAGGDSSSLAGLG